MSTRVSLSLVAIVALVVVGCNQSTPTEPRLLDLSGTWEGPLTVAPTGEDWSLVRLQVTTAGATTTGTITSRNAVTHPVSGQSIAVGAYLDVSGLPHDTPCTVTLIVDAVSSATMQGNLTGRCPSTLMSRFRLQKAQ
jgi:hypothetical protein